MSDRAKILNEMKKLRNDIEQLKAMQYSVSEHKKMEVRNLIKIKMFKYKALKEGIKSDR